MLGAFLMVNVILYIGILFLTVFVLFIDVCAFMFGHATYRYKVLCFYRVLRETDEPMFFAREKVTEEKPFEESTSEETTSEENTSEETMSK